MTEKKLVYVVMNRDEPIGVFETEFAALRRARAESKEWTQPIRVWEVEQNVIGDNRLCAVYEQGYRL